MIFLVRNTTCHCRVKTKLFYTSFPASSTYHVRKKLARAEVHRVVSFPKFHSNDTSDLTGRHNLLFVILFAKCLYVCTLTVNCSLELPAMVNACCICSSLLNASTSTLFVNAATTFNFLIAHQSSKTKTLLLFLFIY